MSPIRSKRTPAPASLGVLLVSLFALAAASCGGGGGDDTPPQPPADARWDQFDWDDANWS